MIVGRRREGRPQWKNKERNEVGRNKYTKPSTTHLRNVDNPLPISPDDLPPALLEIGELAMERDGGTWATNPSIVEEEVDLAVDVEHLVTESDYFVDA